MQNAIDINLEVQYCVMLVGNGSPENQHNGNNQSADIPCHNIS